MTNSNYKGNLDIPNPITTFLSGEAGFRQPAIKNKKLILSGTMPQ